MSDGQQNNAGSVREPMLFGHYERALDSKGRFNLPFRFRQKDLGKEEEPPRFMIFQDRHDVVSLMTTAQYEASLVNARHRGSGQEQRTFLRWLATHSQEVSLDGQGRVAVPQQYLDTIGAKKRVLVLGVGPRMELWEPERYQVTEDAAGDPDDKFFEGFYE